MAPHKLITETIERGERNWITVYWEFTSRGRKRYFSGSSTVSVEAARKRVAEKFYRWLEVNRVCREVAENDKHQNDREAIENFERDRT